VIGEERASATEAARVLAIAQVELADGQVQTDQTALEEGISRGAAEGTVTPLEEAREVRKVITGQALARAAAAALRAWALEEEADAAAVAGADDQDLLRKL
jgi:hypothetical protein